MQSIIGGDEAIRAKGLWALTTLSTIASKSGRTDGIIDLPLIETALIEDGIPQTILRSDSEAGVQSFSLVYSAATSGSVSNGLRSSETPIDEAPYTGTKDVGLHRLATIVIERFNLFLDSVASPRELRSE